MKIGIIGTGNMGTILSEALLESKAISPSDLIVTNRTRFKAERLKHTFHNITITDHPENVLSAAELIFICVKPLDIYPILKANSHLLSREKCLVSITSPIRVEWLEKTAASSCARIIPSITNRALAGVALMTFGERCEDHWKKKLTHLFEHISTPLEIDESITRISSDIVSCGPAFFSYITRRFINAAVKETKINEETATILSEQMLIGLGELLKKGFYSLPALEEKVCVKGGITGEGIKVLDPELDGVFEPLFQATHKKFDHEVEAIKKQFKP